MCVVLHLDAPAVGLVDVITLPARRPQHTASSVGHEIPCKDPDVPTVAVSRRRPRQGWRGHHVTFQTPAQNEPTRTKLPPLRQVRHAPRGRARGRVRRGQHVTA